MGCRYPIRPTKTFHDPVESKTLRLGLHKQLIFTAFDPSKGAAESSPSLVPAPRPTLSMLGTFQPTEPHRHSQAFGGDNPFSLLEPPGIAGDCREELEWFAECGLGGRRNGTICVERQGGRLGIVALGPKGQRSTPVGLKSELRAVERGQAIDLCAG